MVSLFLVKKVAIDVPVLKLNFFLSIGINESSIYRKPSTILPRTVEALVNDGKLEVFIRVVEVLNLLG